MQKVVKNMESNYSPENRRIGKKIEEDVRVERGGYAYKCGGGQASANRKLRTGWGVFSPFQKRFKPSVVSAHKTDATHKKLITNMFMRGTCASGESFLTKLHEKRETHLVNTGDCFTLKPFIVYR